MEDLDLVAAFLAGALIVVFFSVGFEEVLVVVFEAGLASFDKDDLILAALFLCIRLFFTALSTIEVASEIFAGVGLYFAAFTDNSRRCLKSSFFLVLFISCLNFFTADLITGIKKPPSASGVPRF